MKKGLLLGAVACAIAALAGAIAVSHKKEGRS